MKRGGAIPILFSCLLQVASAADLQVTEIQFKSITGYSDDRFILKIRGDRTVEYLGMNFVDTKGRRTSQISQADFGKLVRKIEQIRFFQLQNSYDRYPLDKPAKSSGNIADVERTIVTDQPRQIVTVRTPNGTKTIEDRMAPPKGLREFEELIIDVTHASRWIGASENLHDIPYYESFPLNKRVTFRALLEHYRIGDAKHISGYLLMFMKNDAISFHLEAPRHIEFSRFDGYIVDATGYIKQTSKMDYVFVVTDIRAVRDYLNTETRTD